MNDEHIENLLDKYNALLALNGHIVRLLLATNVNDKGAFGYYLKGTLEKMNRFNYIQEVFQVVTDNEDALMIFALGLVENIEVEKKPYPEIVINLTDKAIL